ncbi:MAG: hypothetical protein ACK500_12715 [Flavobacteriales bacterium]|jgi:hypothetical protein
MNQKIAHPLSRPVLDLLCSKHDLSGDFGFLDNSDISAASDMDMGQFRGVIDQLTYLGVIEANWTTDTLLRFCLPRMNEEVIVHHAARLSFDYPHQLTGDKWKTHVSIWFEDGTHLQS